MSISMSMCIDVKNVITMCGPTQARFPYVVTRSILRHYPRRFGLQITRMYYSLCKRPFGKPASQKIRHWEDVAELFQEKRWADLWDDADMVSVLAYLRGNSSLRLPERWKTRFPEAL